MWLCIPEGKPVWQVKSLQGDPEQTVQISVTTPHCESHWQKTLIG